MSHWGIDIKAQLQTEGKDPETLMHANSDRLHAQGYLSNNSEQGWTELLGAPILVGNGVELHIGYQPLWLPDIYGLDDEGNATYAWKLDDRRVLLPREGEGVTYEIVVQTLDDNGGIASTAFQSVKQGELAKAMLRIETGYDMKRTTVSISAKQ